MELRNAEAKFEAAGIKLYAISYDDREALEDFATSARVRFPLLSDVDSRVIREYGLLNTEIKPGSIPLYGIPYPGAYVTDREGVVVAKFFRESYRTRDSPENLIDAAAGRLVLDDETPVETGDDDRVRLSARLHGGGGTLKCGSQRKVVVRFELPPGAHIYGEDVPAELTPTTLEVSGPPGLVVGKPILPAVEMLPLGVGEETVPVWSGTVDLVVPVHATAELVSDRRPREVKRAKIIVTVGYQVCDEVTCHAPEEQSFELDVPLLPSDVPSLWLHKGIGQNELPFEADSHMRRLIRRKALRNPLGVFAMLMDRLRLLLRIG